MAEDRGAPETGKLRMARPEVVEKQIVRSWTVQNDMRGALFRMTAGTA